MARSEFQYFTLLIFYVMLLYAAVLVIFLCIRRREIRKRRLDAAANVDNRRDDDDHAFHEWTSTVEDVTDSWMGNDQMRIGLLVFRILALTYMFIGGIVLYSIKWPSCFTYFDGWTMIISTLYFLLASLLSIAKVAIVQSRSNMDLRLNPYYAIIDWSYYPRLAAVSSHLLFEVSCASTLVCAFGIALNTSPIEDDITTALSLTICLLFMDFGFNNLKYRFDQFPAAMAWVVFYMLCIWPAVFGGSMQQWPYPFMQVQTSKCFSNYTLVFLVVFVAYSTWYTFFCIKRLALTYLEYKGILVPVSDANPYSNAGRQQSNWENDSQHSSRSGKSDSSLRSRNSRGSTQHTPQQVSVNSYLYTGDLSDLGTDSVLVPNADAPAEYTYNPYVLQAPPQPGLPGTVGPSIEMSLLPPLPPVLTPEQQVELYERQQQQIFQLQQHQALYPPQPGMVYPPPPYVGMDNQSVKQQLSPQQQQLLWLQQQQQTQHMMAMYPMLQDPAYMQEQQQELHMLNLLHNDNNQSANNHPGQPSNGTAVSPSGQVALPYMYQFPPPPAHPNPSPGYYPFPGPM